ncbi:hypothetical protein D6789_00210 [Candidatus Woesearchaeota archaeon]|nr:MAG: hypothetical protein D6789_00210 [Candidatus Woesearchaeota archaeon]
MYLTDFLGARVSTMLRTQRSIMRATLRHFRRLIREYKESRQATEEALKKSEEEGDVDEILRAYEEALTKQLSRFQELMTEEKSVFMAEFRILDDPQEVAAGFAGIRTHLEELKKEEAYKEFAEKLQALITAEKGDSLYAQLRKLEAEEHKAVKLQYKNVLRQEKEEAAVAQDFVLTPSNVMNAVNQLWNLRGDVKKEDRILKELKGIEQRTLKHLKTLEEVIHKKEFGKVKMLEEELLKDTEAMKEDFKKFLELYEEVLKEYLLFTKDATHIFFMFRKENVYLQEFLNHLRDEGFPEEDAEKLVNELKDEQKQIEDIFHTLTNIYRRGARKMELHMGVEDAKAA